MSLEISPAFLEYRPHLYRINSDNCTTPLFAMTTKDGGNENKAGALFFHGTASYRISYTSLEIAPAFLEYRPSMSIKKPQPMTGCGFYWFKTLKLK